MKLEPNFVTDVIRILDGRIPDSVESALLAKRLDSVEEYLAWILLRKDILKTDPNIAKCIGELARTEIVKAETPRTKSGFDIETPQSLEELRAALLDLMKSDETTYKEYHTARDAFTRLAAAKDPGDRLLRFELDIKI